MKYYDKEINKKAEAMKSVLILLVIFFIGYIVGHIAIDFEQKSSIEELQKSNDEKQQHIVELEKLLEEKQVKINEQFTEIDALKETIYMLEVYGK